MILTTDSPQRTRLIPFVLIAILAGASVLYFRALREDTFGFYHDDGVYVVLAKALATNEGYRIISLPQEPSQTKAPPLYPFLLSLIWRAYPQFPENLRAMMLVSVAATLIFLALSYSYLVRQAYSSAWQALVVVALSSINIYVIIFSITVLSDMLCAAISVGGLYLAEKYGNEKRRWATGIALGIILGLAFLTRSAAVALILSVGAYYVLRRQWRKALLVVAVAGVFVAGWVAWCYSNRSSSGGLNAAYSESYLSTFNDVVSGLSMPGQSRIMVLLSLIGKNIFGLILVSIPMVSTGFNYYGLPNLGSFLPVLSLFFILLIFSIIAAGFRRHISRGVRLLHVYIIFYLGLHLLWPYATYSRSLVPLLPFLTLFLLTEVMALGRLARREQGSGKQIAGRIGAATVSLILLALVGTMVYTYGSGMYWSLASLRKIGAAAAKDAQLIEWIKIHTDPDDVLVCERDPIYYLHTGRKATRTSPLKEGALVEGDRSSSQEYEEAIFRIISENNARYLILSWGDTESERDEYGRAYKTMIEQHPDAFLPVFESTDGRSVIYRIERGRLNIS